MQLVIKKIYLDNLSDVNQCDSTFIIDRRLLIFAENNKIRYNIEPVEPYAKRYPAETVDYPNYIGNASQIVYLAYVEGKIAGEIRVRKNWNNFAYIEDLVADAGFRRCGVGRALVQSAIDWARDNRLQGVMLETQNNNVNACLFYEKCGFDMGGFDALLYKGIPAVAGEIAVYMYLTFADEGGRQ